MKAKFAKLSIPFTEVEPTKIKQQITQGTNSVIYSTKNPENVVKFIILDDPKTILYNKNEQYAYLYLPRHPNLCASLCYKEISIKDKKYGCYLLENCCNGSLQEVVSSLQKSLSESLILEIIYQIASGLTVLHALTPPISYRDLNLEKILIGPDGKLKISDFGHISNMQITVISDANRIPLQNEIDCLTNEKYRAPELCDLYSQLPITPASDIWALGCILYLICYKKFPFEGKLAIINNHYAIPDQPQYSEKVINLLKMMFVTKPSERAKALDIINYIKTENMGSLFGEFTFSKNVLQSKKNEMIYGNQKINVEKKEMHVKPKFMDLMNKHFKRLTTKSEGWLLSALEENEEGPKQKYVRYLIIKAWKKSEKVVKFYKFLQKHDSKNIDNCVIIMKSLIVLHNYFKKGPPDALQLKNKEGNPSDILIQINDYWRKVSETKQHSSKDKKRTPYISSLNFKYSTILIKKLKLSMKYSNYFEGNYALTPFFRNPKLAPISIPLIDDLLGFLTLLNEFNQCLLNENALWKIQMSIVLSMIDEEYCLISLLAHLIYALRKASNFIDGKIKEEKLRDTISGLMEKFEINFKNMRIFFLNCKNIKDFEDKEMIPGLKLEVLEFLKHTAILEKNENITNSKRYNVLKDLNNQKNIFDIYLPQSYGKAIKDVKIDEMIGMEESYKNTNLSPLLSRNTIAHSPDYRQSQGLSPDVAYNYDFTQFLVTKKSMEAEEKKKSFSISYPLEDKKKKETETKEQMVYLGFKKGESVMSAPHFDSQDSKNTENFLEIIKKDEASHDLYSEFSHQQLNKSIFDLDKEKQAPLPQTYIEENKFHTPASALERDDLADYQDIDPENLINFDNFNKYLNEQKVSPVEKTENLDVKHEISFKSEEKNEVAEIKEEEKNTIVTNANVNNEDLLTLAHSFTQEFQNNLQLNKITPQKSQHLEEVSNETPLEVSVVAFEEVKCEEAQIKKTESLNKIEDGPINKSPIRPSVGYTEAISENIHSTVSREDTQEEMDPIKQLLGDDEITNINDYIIDYSFLKFGNQIGAGSTSIVFLGKFKTEDVAIKKIKVAEIDESNIIEFKREISALVKLGSHPNLVAFKGVSYSETNVCIITEFCHGGTLFDLLHRKKNISLNWNQRLKFALDIAQGVHYLHNVNPPMIHRDLKSLNLLLEYKIEKPSDRPTIKIADFGLARSTFNSNVEKMTGLMGTFHWMAPEIFENKPYSLKADVYSFGIILWEICARETPYKELKGPHAIMKYVTVDKGRPSLTPIQSDAPEKFLELMQSCWENDPDKRPRMEEVIKILKSIKME